MLPTVKERCPEVTGAGKTMKSQQNSNTARNGRHSSVFRQLGNNAHDSLPIIRQRSRPNLFKHSVRHV